MGIMLSTTVAVSAFTVYKYNSSYSYNGTSGEMGWTVKGTSNQAITTSVNSKGKDLRYVHAYTACKRIADNGIVGTPKSAGLTTRNAGVSAAITRNKTNKNYYYYHQAYLSSSQTSNSQMSYISYSVYQNK